MVQEFIKVLDSSSKSTCPVKSLENLCEKLPGN